MTTHTVVSTSDKGAIFGPGDKFVSWNTLRAAAAQEDKDLAAHYQQLLHRAQKQNEHRLVSEDWTKYGYPLRTGFSLDYAGQAVMRAWEIRRLQSHGLDVRVAYIVTWDRSDNTFTRQASPEYTEYDESLDWVSAHYGTWHNEIGGERTAKTWLYS